MLSSGAPVLVSEEQHLPLPLPTLTLGLLGLGCWGWILSVVFCMLRVPIPWLSKRFLWALFFPIQILLLFCLKIDLS